MDNNINVQKKEKINILRKELNDSILQDKDYSVIYDLSVKLDELIADYYRSNNFEDDINFA